MKKSVFVRIAAAVMAIVLCLCSMGALAGCTKTRSINRAAHSGTEEVLQVAFSGIDAGEWVLVKDPRVREHAASCHGV